MKRILVVDDEAAVLKLLKDMLPALGFEADFASSGNRAVDLLKKETYDLILSDVRMPDVNGIEVATAASVNSPRIPILFMSGNPNVRVEERSFLPKPFNVRQLEAKLDAMLDSDEY